MKNFLCLCFLLLSQNTIMGQSFILLGDEFQSGDNALIDIEQKTNIYYSKSSQNNAINLYHTPFFVFKSNKEGTGLEVRLLDVPGSIDKKQVVITILNSPVVKKKSIVQSIINTENIRPTNPEIKNITDNNLITIPFIQLKITQAQTTGAPIFLPYLNEYTNAPSEIDLIAELPDGQAQILANQLREDKIELQFKVYYEVNARFTRSESEVDVKGLFLYDSKAAKDIIGSGGAFGWRANVVRNQNSTIKKDELIVTRNQKETFTGRVKNEIEIQYRIENENDIQLLQFWQDYFTAIFKPVNISISNGSFSSEIANLSGYGFDKRDIEPDEIDNMINDIKTQFEDETKDNIEITGSGSAKAGFLGIGGDVSASGSYKKDEFRKRMEDFGWKFELKGKSYVPKSLEVFILSEKALKEEGVFNIGVRREFRDRLTGAPIINTKNRLKSEDYSDFNAKYEYAVNYSTPIGAILPFAGTVKAIPKGWKLCNGDDIDIKGHEALFNVIGFNWGKSSDAKFRLPDLQGYFLRGVSGDSGKDPDIDIRTPNGMGVKNEVGSYQKDELKSHTHSIPFENKRNNWAGGGNVKNQAFEDGSNTSALGGNETRPKNAYVNYIIRVN